MKEDGVVQTERVQVAITEVHDITLDVTGCTSQQDVRSRVQDTLKDIRGFARVTLHGELAPAIDLRPADLRSVPTKLESWTVELGELHVGYDIKAAESEATVRGEFVRQVTAADLTEDIKRKVFATGLRALDGRDDLEVT